MQQHTTGWRQAYINLNAAAEADHLELVQLQAGAFWAVDFLALLGVATFGRMNLLHINLHRKSAPETNSKAML